MRGESVNGKGVCGGGDFSVIVDFQCHRRGLAVLDRAESVFVLARQYLPYDRNRLVVQRGGHAGA